MKEVLEMHVNMSNRWCGLAEEVFDRLYGLSSLQILDLSANNLLIVSNEIGCLSSLQLQLHLSENKFMSIPNEIGHLSSLQLLDLSDNNFMSMPESISHLSELTELHLFRCSKLQSLPKIVPFNLKHVHAQECPS
ncbi:putative leucine-rich repeat domain, L domain-containing protein [Rosa chinensis]|uniref:Putative leucine-rich repeat domain, L domain-containing protein n=1 Tax=Rosa chinensis TaxID=74649 RepID=A0A2P6P351_ROSCH|nr:putative leucine-rich repeat domain, L domain-containing protein [Rosa chinensis]